MELKGNIQIEERYTDVDTVGERNLPQIKVTKTYKLTGVDLSQGEKDTGNDDDDSSRADELADEAKAQLEKYFHEFYLSHNKDRSKAGDPYDVTNSSQFIGLECEVMIYGVELIESLKNCSIDLEVSAYYDVPIQSLESAIDGAKTALLGK